MTAPKRLCCVLLATMNLLFAACDHTPKEWKTPNMTALTPRLQPLFEKTKTICFGRFMVDVPASTTVAWGSTIVPLTVNIYPNGVDVVKTLAQKFIHELKSENAIYLNDIPLLISVDNVSQPEGQIVTGYEGFEAIKELKINGYFKLNNDGVVINARPLLPYKDRATATITSIARRLRQRAENEIPTEPGNCIEHAFLPDEPGTPKEPPGELISIGFRLQEFPDTHISIKIRPANPEYSESDSLEWQLQRLERRLKAEDSDHPQLQTVYFRKGPRQIHDWVNGFEALSRSPERPDFPSIQDFGMDFRGVALDYLKPYADIRMQTGVAGNVIGATKASLTDEEAIAVWDKITSTIRVRPTGNAAVKTAGAAPGPHLSLGELAATGRTCPQTGWWIPSEPGEDKANQRLHIKAGERMPHVVSVGEPSLWQKLKGEKSSYRTATVWKLVAYGDPPAQTDLAADAPTDKKG